MPRNSCTVLRPSQSSRNDDGYSNDASRKRRSCPVVLPSVVRDPRRNLRQGRLLALKQRIDHQKITTIKMCMMYVSRWPSPAQREAGGSPHLFSRRKRAKTCWWWAFWEDGFRKPSYRGPLSIQSNLRLIQPSWYTARRRRCFEQQALVLVDEKSEDEVVEIGESIEGGKNHRGSYLAYLNPHVFVEGTSDQTSLEEQSDALLVTHFDFEIKVVLPVLDLCFLQGFHVEVRAFDL